VVTEDSTSITAVPSTLRQEPQAGDVVENTIGMKFSWIPAGDFLMGSNKGEPDEQPVHRVKLDKGFFMSHTEVTQAQYCAIIGGNPSHFKGDNLPVDSVTWNESVAF